MKQKTIILLVIILFTMSACRLTSSSQPDLPNEPEELEVPEEPIIPDEPDFLDDINELGMGCQEHSDCISNYCMNGVCEIASCADGIKNGLETGIDCGGPYCPPCEVGLSCLYDSDCAQGTCMANICTIQE